MMIGNYWRLALSAAIALGSWSTPARSATIWTDWSTDGLNFSTGSDGAANGTMGGVSVSYTGQLIHGIVDGTSTVWLPNSTFVDGAIVTDSPDTVGDNLDIDGSTPGGTITFSSPVLNPVFAILSLGQPGSPASFTFDQLPTFVVGGPSTPYGGSTISVAGNIVSGEEGSGVVQFVGTYSSISWTNTPESFYYFTVGAPSGRAVVPEPASATLLGFGLVGLVAFLKKRRR